MFLYFFDTEKENLNFAYPLKVDFNWKHFKKICGHILNNLIFKCKFVNFQEMFSIEIFFTHRPDNLTKLK